MSYQTCTNPELGRHLRATKYIQQDETIFTEKPLCFLQSITNVHEGVLTCHNCNSFIGGPDLSISLLSRTLARQSIPQHDLYNYSTTTTKSTSTNESSSEEEVKDNNHDSHAIIPCSNNCGVYYCSTKCKQINTIHYGHDILCTGTIKDGEEDISPLYAFKIHACENNEIFLIIGHIIISIISEYIQTLKKDISCTGACTSTSVLRDTVMKPYFEFMWKPWWEIMDDKETSDVCLRLCEESSTLLKDTLHHYSHNYFNIASNQSNNNDDLIIIKQAISDCLFLCSSEYFGRLIGNFELNCIGVRASQPNPLWDHYFKNDPDFQQRNSMQILTLLEEELDKDEDEDEDQEENCCEEEENVVFCQPTLQKDATTNDPISLYNLQQQLRQILSNNDEQQIRDDVLTPLDGTAIFTTACQMNHSCQPNVYVRYKLSTGWGYDHPLELQCVALCDIQPDEELRISYINQELCFEERMLELKNYHFLCSCVKCLLEISNTKTETCDDENEDAGQTSLHN